MNYIQSRSQLNREKPSKNGSSRSLWLLIAFLLIALVIIAFSIKLPGQGGETVESTEIEENRIEESAVHQDVAAVEEPENTFEEIDLHPVGDFEASAVARRGEEDGLFSHVVVADLPAIDSSLQYYEGWLVKPGVVEFFSTGEMFARADGKWGLIWEIKRAEAKNDLLDYRQVIITLENRDEDSSPSADHILEGIFPEN